MFDSFNRSINYLRISVTDRCNLRCVYCMPAEGIDLISHKDILTYEEIARIAQIAVSLGINKIRLTGGEPLARKGISDLVTLLAEIPGVADLAMTTNGTMLEEHAHSLKEAGLMRINVSLDTVDPDKFREITRGGDVSKVFRGIEAAKQAGLNPIKLNCVIQSSVEEKDAQEVKQFAINNGLEIRFIHQMSLSKGHFTIVEGGDGGDCNRCNRLRLTANGFIKPCLFNDMVFHVRKLGAEEAILQAIGRKPAAGTRNCSGHFYNIGG